ncbi:MAG: CHAP domain-containing protein, partial [Pyrinomonadaceae bacterium]
NMTVAMTSQNRPVTHFCHPDEIGCGEMELTPARIAEIRQLLSTEHPNAVEVAPPTVTYNCHGFAVGRSHGWFAFPQFFFTDDFFEVPLNAPQVGDVVVYYNGTVLTHTAVVKSVSGNQITLVRSKWADMSLLDHEISDVPPYYKTPRMLLRRKPGIAPLVNFTDDVAMAEVSPNQEIIDSAIRSFSNPQVYLRVLLASAPDVARLIIESLPGVQELLALGPEVAGKAALDFLSREETRANKGMTSIALYILQRTLNEEAVPSLASAIRERKFTGLNMYLAADALLSSARIEPAGEDPVTAAIHAAEKLK